MNRHLTSRQISEWASGERSPEARQHVEDCPECRAGVTRLAEVLAGFRGSVHQWSERRMSGEFSLARERRRFPLRTWCLAGVAVAVMVVLALVMISPARPVVQMELARADAALLQRVDAEISRSVPGPMEPLMKLVAWDEGTEARAATRPQNR